MTDVYLGVDIGTASTKGVLATTDGKILATATRAHAMSLPKPGWAEMDAETIGGATSSRSARSWLQLRADAG